MIRRRRGGKTVEALQYTGHNLEEAQAFLGASGLSISHYERVEKSEKPLPVLKYAHPLRQQTIFPGWWLLRTREGKNLLAVPPGRFEEEYR